MIEYIEPDQRLIEEFITQFPSNTPVVMLNLLKFNPQANYAAGQDVEPCTGLEAFLRYGMGVTPMIEAAGGEQVWQGRPMSMLIGPQHMQWDLAVLVRYPSAKAFVDMVSSAEYTAISFHRTAALEDSRLIANQEL